MSGIGGARVRFPASVFRILKTGALTIQQIFDLSNLTANRTVTMPDKDGTLAMTSDIAAAADVPDNTFRISDNGDSTKKIAFEASGIDASTVRTFTAPNRNHTLGGVELWATATKYIIGDVIGISYLGSVRQYRCTTAHTASAAFETDVASKWTLLSVMNFETALFALMQTADPTKLATFDLSLLTASRQVTLPDKAGTMAMTSDISAGSLADTQFLYRQAIQNNNFENWSGGTSFTNPATALELADDWFIRKSNGGGTAPSINISRDTTIPNKLSAYSLKADVTATGTANATTQYEIYNVIKDFKKFQGKNISIGIYITAPSASEKIDLLLDDGVSTNLIARKTVTNSATLYKYENISINSAATKLEFIFRIAGGTGLSIASSDNFVPSTTGAFYFAQVQLNEGSNTIDFKPYKIKDNVLSAIRRKGGNTKGSTNTNVLIFGTAVYAQGDDITYQNSAANGDSFLINETGIYTLNWSMYGGGGSGNYMVIGVGTLSNNHSYSDTQNRAIQYVINSVSEPFSMSWTGIIRKGESIWVHYNASLTSNDDVNMVSISRVA